MKAKPMKEVESDEPGTHYEECEPEEATHLSMRFPGPFWYRLLPVMTKGTRDGTPNWTWNGDVDKPTLKPSILTRTGQHLEEVCHSFVNDGKVRFLPDCTHEFAGKTVDLLDVED